MRKHTRGLVAGVFIALLVVSFAIWGINDVFTSSPSDAVASGKGVKVTGVEFSRAYEGAMTEVRQQNGGRSPTPQEVVTAGLDRQVLDRLVTEAVLDRLADRMGFSASNKMVADQISGEPAFQSQLTNKFDRNTYISILGQNQLTPEMYEANLRSGLKRQQLAQAASGGGFAPKAFTDFIFNFETEKRSVTVAAATPALAGAPPEPTQAELQAFYEQNKARFQTPEYRKVSLVIASPAAFEAKVVVPEEKIRALYDFQVGRSGGTEKRSFVQISAQNEAQAAEAARRLGAGEDPQAVATALKLPAIPFNAVTKQQVPDPALAEAVFAMKEGQTTNVIKGALAWATAKVTKIETGAAPAYETVREQLRAQLAREESDSALNDAVQKFEEERSGGKTLEQAAQGVGLLVVVHDRVTAQGTDASGAPIQTISEDPTFVQQIFATAGSESTDFTPLKEGGYVLARVDDIIPAGARPLEEVRPLLVLSWKAQKTNEAIKKIADALVEDVKSGKPFAASARARKMQVISPEPVFTRQTIQQSPIGTLAGQVFSAKPNDVFAGPGSQGGAFYVVQVTKIDKVDPAGDMGLYNQAKAAAANFIDQDLLLSLQSAAMAEAKVKYNDKLRHQTIGYTTEDGAAAP